MLRNTAAQITFPGLIVVSCAQLFGLSHCSLHTNVRFRHLSFLSDGKRMHFALHSRHVTLVPSQVWACPQSPKMPDNCLSFPEKCPFEEYGFQAVGLRYCDFEVPGRCAPLAFANRSLTYLVSTSLYISASLFAVLEQMVKRASRRATRLRFSLQSCQAMAGKFHGMTAYV